MKRNWTGIVAGYILLGFLGATTVLVATAFARAWTVRQTLSRAERMLDAGRPGAALTHLDRVKAWSAAFSALEKRRLCLAVRCHVLRMDVPHARNAAEDTIEADTDALASHGTGAVDYMLTSLVELAWLRTDPGSALSPWCGYAVLIRELRRTGQADAVGGVLEAAAARFPDGRMPSDVRALLDGVAASIPLAAPVRQPRVTATSTTALQPSGADAGTGSPAVVTAADTAAPVSPASEPDPDEVAPDVATEPETTNTTDAGSAAAVNGESGGPTGATPHRKPGAAGWGIVTAGDGHAYDINGKFRRTLSAGTVVEVRDVRDTGAGRLAICRLTDTVGPSVLVPVAELELRPGRYTDTSVAERRLRSRRAVVAAKLEKTRKKASPPEDDGLSDANPHAAAYREAKAGYEQLQRRAADVQAKWDSATGGERMKYADQLREMKGEQVRLEAALEAARSKADAWTAANPAPPKQEQPAPVESEEQIRYSAELAEIDKQLEAL